MRTQLRRRPGALDEAMVREAMPLIDARLGAPAGAAEADSPSGRAWPTYAVPANSLRSAAPAEAAVEIGWRTVVRRGDRAALTEFGNDRDGVLTVRQVSYGAVAAGLLSARAVVDDLPDDAAGAGAPVEERVLTVPAAYFTGVWLHQAASPDADVVIPTPPIPDGLEAGRAYPFKELCALLAERVVETPP